MNKTVPLLLIALFALSSQAEDAGARLHFKVNGYSIAPLDEKSDAESYASIMMFLPPSDAFAPNVTVLVQTHKGTIKQYADLSKEQFKKANWTVIRETVTPTGVAAEYSGLFNGRKMHWLSRAEIANGKAYLVTATATEAQWHAVAAKLKACLESFGLEKGG